MRATHHSWPPPLGLSSMEMEIGVEHGSSDPSSPPHGYSEERMHPQMLNGSMRLDSAARLPDLVVIRACSVELH